MMEAVDLNSCFILKGYENVFWKSVLDDRELICTGKPDFNLIMFWQIMFLRLCKYS